MLCWAQFAFIEFDFSLIIFVVIDRRDRFDSYTATVKVFETESLRNN